MRRTLVQNLGRRGSLDDITIARNVVRMRVGTDYVFDLESMPFHSFEHALRRIRGVHDRGLLVAFATDEVREIPITIYANLLEYHYPCLAVLLPDTFQQHQTL